MSLNALDRNLKTLHRRYLVTPFSMSHHRDDHGHGHDHGEEIEPALQTLLWKQVDFESIRTLNESETDQGAKVVEKTWPQRLEPEPMLESDADEQLLMFIP